MCRAFCLPKSKGIAHLCAMTMAVCKNTFLATMVLILLGPCAKADVGETHDLKIERANLLAFIEAQSISDSTLTTDKMTELLGLYKKLNELDQRIMASMNQTIVREQNAKANGRKWQAALGKLAVVWALVIAAMVALHRVSLKMLQPFENESTIGFYKRSTMLLISQLKPNSTSSFDGKINPIVAFGVAGMALSLLLLLLQML